MAPGVGIGDRFSIQLVKIHRKRSHGLLKDQNSAQRLCLTIGCPLSAAHAAHHCYLAVFPHESGYWAVQLAVQSTIFSHGRFATIHWWTAYFGCFTY